ncbi:hypothetical protein Poli38472_010504 [Pythium oligandrum]|uniref:Uncharacterized protein n=1 Tax=Pythium oligandrum TaxID=41045 RepID=A0A8K1FDI3_PYTOL|nr:hypothetical protein Poli38472_010504 [Pythium oligandrum]|eukprot:TMW55622.1 hypothetical protein Poli38472_010504 [Pythium oligandrum]
MKQVHVREILPGDAPHWESLRKRIRRITGDKADITSRTHTLLLHPDFWLEALDEQHRYGFHLRAFHAAWKLGAEPPDNQTDRSFFDWLDHGAGQELDLPDCSYRDLKSTRVEYCDPIERQQYEVEFIADPSDNGDVRLRFKTTHTAVHTDDLNKWIFVLERLYIARKRKGRFHHSSFLAGEPVAAAGKIVVQHGQIHAIEPHSGHFKPTLTHLLFLCHVLAKHGVALDTIEFVKPKKWRDEWPFANCEVVVADDGDVAKSDTDESS